MVHIPHDASPAEWHSHPLTQGILGTELAELCSTELSSQQPHPQLSGQACVRVPVREAAPHSYLWCIHQTKRKKKQQVCIIYKKTRKEEVGLMTGLGITGASGAQRMKGYARQRGQREKWDMRSDPQHPAMGPKGLWLYVLGVTEEKSEDMRLAVKNTVQCLGKKKYIILVSFFFFFSERLAWNTWSMGRE